MPDVADAAQNHSQDHPASKATKCNVLESWDHFEGKAGGPSHGHDDVDLMSKWINSLPPLHEVEWRHLDELFSRNVIGLHAFCLLTMVLLCRCERC